MVQRLSEKDKGRAFRRYLGTDAGKQAHDAHLKSLAWARHYLNSVLRRTEVAACHGTAGTASQIMAVMGDSAPADERLEDTKAYQKPLLDALREAVWGFQGAQARIHGLAEASLLEEHPPVRLHGRVFSAAASRRRGDVLLLSVVVPHLDGLHAALATAEKRLKAQSEVNASAGRSEDQWLPVLSDLVAHTNELRSAMAADVEPAQKDCKAIYDRYYVR